MTTHDDELVLCCLLWAHPGRESELTRYESRVLEFVADAGGEVLQRVAGDGADGQPHEVQLFRFPSHDALDRYLTDPRRLALTADRDRAVARTELFPVRAV